MAAETITPEEAEAVVEARIEDFGLGALPKVSVSEDTDGKWHIKWTWHTATCAPMSMEAWRAWVEENIGPLSPEHLKSTEG